MSDTNDEYNLTLKLIRQTGERVLISENLVRMLFPKADDLDAFFAQYESGVQFYARGEAMYGVEKAESEGYTVYRMWFSHYDSMSYGALDSE